jgi:SAM-dependent methyltransferase
MLPDPFNYYKAILKGDHLHFGLWSDGTSQATMEEAQENMFNVLLSFFPPPPARVLDVGCGLGYSAFLLAQKGYTVIAIAPDAELIAHAKRFYGESGAEFRKLSYFDEDNSVFSKGEYDVLLFQESTQYLRPLQDVFKKARHLLKEKGILVIGDEVLYDRSIGPETAAHPSSDFILTLAESGFRVTEHQKIGESVLPTCDFVISNLIQLRNSGFSKSDGPKSAEKLEFYIDGWKRQEDWYVRGQMGYELFVARKDKFFIRPYAEGDESKIVPMFNNMFHVNRTFDHWYWKFRDNPYGSFKIACAFTDDNELVAHYAGYPVPFYSEIDKPETFISFQIGDTMTKPGVRNVGLGRTGLLARTAFYYYAKFCDGVLPFIYGYNTGNIRKLGVRYLKYTYIDPVPLWMRDIVNNPVKPPSFLAGLLSAYRIDEAHSVTEDWTEFFRRVRSSYKLLISRDAAYLRWRYLNCPDKIHRIFSIRKRGRLVGWSVFSKKDNRLIWGDALFDKKYPESVSYFLYALLNSHFQGIETVEGWFSPNPGWWNNRLKELGFRTVREPNDLTPGVVIFDASLLEQLKKHFYYTMGDSDLF